MNSISYEYKSFYFIYLKKIENKKQKYLHKKDDKQ